MFATEPVTPNIKIQTFLHTDSIIMCFVCCLLGIGTKIVKNQYTRLRLTNLHSFHCNAILGLRCFPHLLLFNCIIINV